MVGVFVDLFDSLVDYLCKVLKSQKLPHYSYPFDSIISSNCYLSFELFESMDSLKSYQEVTMLFTAQLPYQSSNTAIECWL